MFTQRCSPGIEALHLGSRKHAPSNLPKWLNKSSSPPCLTTKTPKLARKELEKSQTLEIAVPRPLSSTIRLVITTQLKLEIAVTRPLSSTYRCWHSSGASTCEKQKGCWRTPPPAVSPRVSRGVRCSPHGILQYDIGNDRFPADSAPRRPPRWPTRTPPHQRGSTTGQTRRQTRRSAVHKGDDMFTL